MFFMSAAGGAEPASFRFEPAGGQEKIPERYRLSARAISYAMKLKRALPKTNIEIYDVSFRSPVTSPCPENNTVYAEYYLPRNVAKIPGVIVLDITAGGQQLTRGIALTLAQHGIASLFVQMAYYGPRRPPGSRLRLMSTDIPRTMEAIRQTVLDVRCAAAWLANRPEIDAARIGIHGTSLGSMVGALAAEMEPRIRRVSILLGGGGLVDAYYDHPQAARYRRFWEAFGGTKEVVARLLAPIDPITCAGNLKDRKVLMVAGKRDDVVPPKATEALWKAAGQPTIVWYDCTHYTALLYYVPIMKQVVKHFSDP
jgi:cephalosporin-C deacetylase-like acetyl esterase